jgi:phosphate:Na+ symporter
MNTIALLGALFGGIGLFQLGMWLMTDGLKVAAGEALRRTLETWTRSPLRALVAGTGLTATLQSSSAVTVATVGFVNAGLLTLGQAVWVVYGSNVGTTVTGWIVAVTGIQVKLDAYALPLIALGMVLRLTGLHTRRAAYGQALVGFAVFLLGIQALKTSFTSLAGQVDLAALPQQGWAATAAFFAIGMALTLLIQSSSVTTAIALTVASTGIVPVEHAALVIIGADLGTSSTAAFAAIGATAGARRVAAAHVLFNAVTAVFAVATLPWLMVGIVAARNLIGLPDEAGITLALFSTAFNVLGVILMLPFTAAMVRWLERRFVSREEDLARPRYLDDTLFEVPALSLRGLTLEVQRLGQMALALAAEALGRTPQALEALHRRGIAIDRLGEHIRDFVGRMNRSLLPTQVADALAPLLRALQHYEELADLAVAGPVPEPLVLVELSVRREDFVRAAAAVMAAAEVASPGFDAQRLEQAAAEEDRVYESLKARLLQAAAQGRIGLPAMDAHIQDIGRQHRTVERAVKAAQRIAPLRQPG